MSTSQRCKRRITFHGLRPDRYLQGLVEAGFEKRIMFGSDFPRHQLEGIEAIQRAPFLTMEQKADILCRNAARFLRLKASICTPATDRAQR